MNKPAAIYARVSSGRQKADHTIVRAKAILQRQRRLLAVC